MANWAGVSFQELLELDLMGWYSGGRLVWIQAPDSSLDWFIFLRHSSKIYLFYLDYVRNPALHALLFV
jgi:hypothetical protein